MRVTELREVLNKMGIDKMAYSINSVEYPNEAYCIFWNGSEWEVYYSERGQKSGLKKFTNEDEACNFFVDKFESSWNVTREISSLPHRFHNTFGLKKSILLNRHKKSLQKFLSFWRLNRRKS